MQQQTYWNREILKNDTFLPRFFEVIFSKDQARVKQGPSQLHRIPEILKIEHFLTLYF